MFVALGTYTPDAIAFAAQVGMTLVDGDELLRIIAAGLDGEPLAAAASGRIRDAGMSGVRHGDGAPHGAARAERRRGVLGLFDLPDVPRHRADSRGRRGHRVSHPGVGYRPTRVPLAEARAGRV